MAMRRAQYLRCSGVFFLVMDKKTGANPGGLMTGNKAASINRIFIDSGESQLSIMEDIISSPKW
jgi:hypothetical protein